MKPAMFGRNWRSHQDVSICSRLNNVHKSSSTGASLVSGHIILNFQCELSWRRAVSGGVRSRLDRVCSASRGLGSRKKQVTETESSSPAGGGSEDDEGLQLIIARDGPNPSSMMEMWWDSFACSSYCGAPLTESSACEPQSIMCSPASDAEARDGLRGELPAGWLKKLGQ